MRLVSRTDYYFVAAVAWLTGCTMFENGCYGPCPPSCRRLEVEIAPQLALPYHAELVVDGEAASFDCAAVGSGQLEGVAGVRMGTCSRGGFVLLEAPDDIHVFAEERDGGGSFENLCNPAYGRVSDTPYDCHCDQSLLRNEEGCPAE